MLILLCTLILTACSGTGNINEQLSSWVGLSEEHLIDNWGMPDSVFTIDADSRVLTYVDYNGEGDAQPYNNEIAYGAIVEPDFNLLNENENGVESCKISFTVNNSIVTGYNFNGDDCTGNILTQNN